MASFPFSRSPSPPDSPSLRRQAVRAGAFCFAGGDRVTTAERFWSKVDVRGEDECWEWTAGKDRHGYGQFYAHGENVIAHRFAWTLVHGDVPKGTGHHGLCVCHSCDNRACQNPSHFFLGSNLDNMQDMVRKGRSIGVGKGAPSKLSVEQVRFVVAHPELSSASIARELGVTGSAIGAIRRGVCWNAITGIPRRPR